jgi:hypothetical protein
MAKNPMRHYYILLDGEYVGQTMAVSEAQARNNYWWKEVKGRDAYSERWLDPTDFEAISIGG